MNWEPVIGIEVHVELQTASKMFCGCAVGFGAEPNTNVCPTCLALPGALPVANRTAISWITQIGLALNCTVAPTSVFHRKNYYYPDLPKNYQISQYDEPVCVDGYLDVLTDGEESRIRINRAHMEEDTGKSLHLGDGGRIHAAEETLLDFNRAGVPLVEIVTEPDIHSAAQARAYAQSLRSLIVELGVSDAKLEEGSIRFDANISIRPQGTETLGTKVEIKNMNSFRSLERAVDYEISRQIQALEAGEKLVQETRHWDEAAGVTHSMRSKEGSSDYRYFTEPDLVPLEISADTVEEIRATLPEPPAERRARYEGLGVDQQNAGVLVAGPRELRELFDDAVEAGAPARTAANWITGEITAYLRRNETALESTGGSAAALAELAGLVEDGSLSATAAKDVLSGVLDGEGSPQQVAESRDLLQIQDRGALEDAVDDVLSANPDQFRQLQEGNQKVIGFFVGQVMRATGGKADPRQVQEILRSRV